MLILVVTLKRKSNADKISVYANSIYCCAICSESQEIPLGEAAFLDKLEQDFKDVYPDMESPVKDGCEATLRKLFGENLIGNN